MTLSYLISSSRPAMRVAAVLSCLVAFAVLTACAPPPVIPPSATAPWPLGPGDHLRIIVFEQNQLGGEFVVDEDGTVSLPLIGRLKMAGMLPTEAEQVVTERLGAGIVKKPKVNIDASIIGRSLYTAR